MPVADEDGRNAEGKSGDVDKLVRMACLSNGDVDLVLDG